MSAPEMTQRQADAWPAAVDEVRSYGAEAPARLWEWVVQWDDESRPGRGHTMHALWLDGEYVAEVYMDVYGYPTVVVAFMDLIHNSGDDECSCEPCKALQAEES